MVASKSIAIVGGGIAGLAAAHRLAKLSNNTCNITIFESANRLGGWIQSTISNEGGILESGPRSVRPVGLSGRAALNLVRFFNIVNY